MDRFIALTEFAKAKFGEAGFPKDKIAVKPNFVEDVKADASDMPRSGALFVGRLSPEKGISTLLRAWGSLEIPLRIAGDGPLYDAVQDAALAQITPLGRKTTEEILSEMTRAEFLVMPSDWYEGFPMTLAEAYCKGLPVIASRLGAMAEIVEDGVTGLHFTPGDAEDLVVKVRWAVEHPEEMRRFGLNARRVYEEKYTPEANFRQLMSIYQEAAKGSRKD